MGRWSNGAVNGGMVGWWDTTYSVHGEGGIKLQVAA